VKNYLEQPQQDCLLAIIAIALVLILALVGLGIL
jgi:hypothetical protein